MLVAGPGSLVSEGNGVARHCKTYVSARLIMYIKNHTAASISARVLPAGRVTLLLAGGGTGITSEQSVKRDRVCPVVASFVIAARNLAFIRCSLPKSKVNE